MLSTLHFFVADKCWPSENNCEAERCPAGCPRLPHQHIPDKLYAGPFPIVLQPQIPKGRQNGLATSHLVNLAHLTGWKLEPGEDEIFSSVVWLLNDKPSNALHNQIKLKQSPD